MLCNANKTKQPLNLDIFPWALHGIEPKHSMSSTGEKYITSYAHNFILISV